MRVRPLVLLDVDGVLNALRSPPDPAVWSDWRTGEAQAAGRTWPLRWSPSVVAGVRRWTELADVQWLTTWGHAANAGLAALLGLPQLPVAGTHDAPPPVVTAHADPDADALAEVTPAAPDPLSGRWWKFDVVRALLADGPRPLVWVDDDLAGDADVRAWVRGHSRCLLVAPHPLAGLTAPELAAVQRFLVENGSHSQ